MTSKPNRTEAASSVLNDACYDLPPYYGEETSYMLCSTPRCGSTLLEFLLLKCGAMGVPHEYLNTSVHMPALARRFGLLDSYGRLNLDQYIEEVRRRRTTANGVFGLKAHYNQISALINNRCIAGLLSESKLVRIKRHNTFDQAISYYIALRTGRWSSPSGVSVERPHVHYDFEGIKKAVSDIKKEEDGWDTLTYGRSSTIFTVLYDDLVKSPNEVCRSICGHIGVKSDFVFDLDLSGLAIQRTELNDILKDRFISDARRKSIHLEAIESP